MKVNVYAEDLAKSVVALETKAGYIGLSLTWDKHQGITIWGKTVGEIAERLAFMYVFLSRNDHVEQNETTKTIITEEGTSAVGPDI